MKSKYLSYCFCPLPVNNSIQQLSAKSHWPSNVINVTDIHTLTLNNKQMISLSEAGMYVMLDLLELIEYTIIIITLPPFVQCKAAVHKQS